MTEPTPGNPRSARRTAARQKRTRIAVAGALAMVLLVVLGVVLFAGGGSDTTAAKAAKPVATTPPTTLPATTTTTTPPHAVTATSKVPNIQVFDGPGSPKVVTTFSAQTPYYAPRTFLVTEDQGDWLKALLPMRPNQSIGWIRKSDVALGDSPYEIRVDLAKNKLTMLKDGKVVLESDTVDGSTKTPTPLGTYYITDPVDLRSEPNGSYGAYALGLSGYSEVLFEFNGGPGQIAIHGTNQPQLMGQDVSNGCIRVPNDVVVEIATQVPLGTPVIIT